MSRKRERTRLWGIAVMALAAAVVWDITSTVAEKRSGSLDRAMIGVLHGRAPKQNSIVGICNSSDPVLGDLQAPLDAVLTYAQVDSVARVAVQRSGGLGDLIEPGDWVCIKINMVARHNAAAATDLRVVKSMIGQLIEEGDAETISVVEGGAWCSDPGNDGWTDHYSDYDNLSYQDMVTDLDTLNPQVTINYVDLNVPPYTQDVPVPGGGLSQSSYTIPDAILHCDKLISAAVHKTHYYAGVTLAHKNYIGISPNSVYGQGGCAHYGVDHDKLERTIVDLFSYHPADLAISECNIGMQGQGPTGGSWIRRNVVVASRDPVAHDAISAYIMGFNPWDIDHLHWSSMKGYGTHDFDHITVVGPDINSIRYDFAKATHLDTRGGPWELPYYQGRACRTWLINGTRDGTDINYDYLGGVEESIAPTEGDTTAGSVWTVFSDVDDYMDLAAHYGGPSSCITYAFTQIISDSTKAAHLRFGSDDGIKIWLNGDSIFADANSGSWSSLVEEDIPITLQEGINRLLVKMRNTTGGYGFSLFVCEPDGDTPLWMEYAIQRQAPDAPALVLPEDSAMIGDMTPTFIWSSTTPVSGSYTLEYALDSDFAEGAVTKMSLLDTAYTVPDGEALSNTTYYWHVKAVVDTLESGYQTHPFMFTIAADSTPPEITLNYPDNGALGTDPFMQLSVTVTDQSPMTVWIYGDATPGGTDLLYVEENVTGTDILYDWTAPVLEPETGHTMGLWHLDEGTGTSVSDESENTNSGSFSGDPNWTAGGRFGYALDFDGTDDYLVIPDDASLDVDSATGAITMEAWIYPHSVAGGTWRSIVGKRGFGTGSGPCNYEMTLDQSTGNLLFYSGHWPQVWVSSIYIPSNEWSYVAITLDATEGRVRFYRNGTERDSIDGAVFGSTSDYPLYIGVSGYAAQCFDGLIDEVRLSNRVLNADEIWANHKLDVGTYYWKVQAEDASANDSTSETRWFSLVPSGPDTLPPEITLNAPSDGSTTGHNHMQLDLSVTDESPMTVWIYGDTTPGAIGLLYVEENVTGTDILYDWTAPVLEPEAGHTMGLWHLDEGTGTSVSDESENTNSGSFSGDPNWTAGGRFGYALDFDGTDDYLVIPDDASLDVDSASGALTMEAWVYPHTLGGGRWRSIVSKRGFGTGGGSCNYEMSLDNTGAGNLLFYSGRYPEIWISSIPVPVNEWSYLAITLDAPEGRVRFYRNGLHLDSLDNAWFGTAHDYPLYIGVANATSQCFDGVIDEVRLTKRILSSEEISGNYELGVATYCWRVRAEDASANDSTSETRCFSVVLDTLRPGPITHFRAEPGHHKVSLRWTNPSGKQSPLAGTLIRRVGWSGYPEYDPPVPEYPDGPTEGDSVMFVLYPESTYIDIESVRDIYYYSAFAKDETGKYSVSDSSAQDRATSYWLGDFTDDGYVEFDDLMIFSNCFGTSEGEPGWNVVCDIGPTHDYSRTGVPEPDDAINFEDLMIFAMNFWYTGPLVLSGEDPSGELSLALGIPASVSGIPVTSVGEEFEARLVLKNGANLVKGMRVTLEFDASVLELVEVGEGSGLKSLESPVFFKSVCEESGVEIVAAVLGTGLTLQKSEEIIAFRFRVVSAGETGLRFESVDLRGVENQKLEYGAQDIRLRVMGRVLPKAYALGQSYPNPFGLETYIRYQLPKEAQITLKVYDAAGKLVRTLVDEGKEPGYHTVRWDRRNETGLIAPAGVYFYRLVITGEDGYTFTRKMVSVR